MGGAVAVRKGAISALMLCFIKSRLDLIKSEKAQGVVVDDKTIMNAPGITSVDKDNLQLLYDLIRKRNRG